MSLIHEAPVFKLAYDLIKELHLARKLFIKSEKYSLGESLEESAIALLMKITEDGQAKRDWKATAIDTALLHLEKIKILLRLASDLGQINERRIMNFQETMQNIGRMLGGWRKSL